MKVARAYSPGRVVLSGEHSVLYGQKAVVASIDLGTNIRVSKGKLNGLSKNTYFVSFLKTFSENLKQDVSNLDFKIISNLPQKTGLSSSSALAHALVKALASYFGLNLTQDEFFELVLLAERQIFPVSGMDQAAVVYGGLRQVQNFDSEIKNFELQSTALKNKKFLLINSGQATENTAEMVTKVKNSLLRQPQTGQEKIQQIGKITKQLINDLKQDDFNPELFSQNERLLETLGVVGEKAQNMIHEIETIGGFAKVTGAGGVRSGSGMLLCYHETPEKLEHLVKTKNWEFYPVTL